MDSFTFMIHLVHAERDVAREFTPLGYVSEGWIECFSSYCVPIEISHITGVRARIDKEIEG